MVNSCREKHSAARFDVVSRLRQRSPLRMTSLRPDHTASTAQTLLSTKPSRSATARITSSLTVVATLDLLRPRPRDPHRGAPLQFAAQAHELCLQFGRIGHEEMRDIDCRAGLRFNDKARRQLRIAGRHVAPYAQPARRLDAELGGERVSRIAGRRRGAYTASTRAGFRRSTCNASAAMKKPKPIASAQAPG